MCDQGTDNLFVVVVALRVLPLDQSHWDDSYWKEIGLGDFPEEGYCRIGVLHVIEPFLLDTVLRYKGC